MKYSVHAVSWVVQCFSAFEDNDGSLCRLMATVAL